MGSHTSTTSARTRAHKPVTHHQSHAVATGSLPSIWWWLALGSIAALMVWGWVEVLLSSRVTPVMQLLLLGVIALLLMMSRNWWWHPQRKGLQTRAIVVLLLAGMLFAVLGNLLEAVLGAQLPRLFLYPNLLAGAALVLLWYRDPHR